MKVKKDGKVTLIKGKRGKWYRDPWLRILQMLGEMSYEERQRCIRATADFYKNR